MLNRLQMLLEVFLQIFLVQLSFSLINLLLLHYLEVIVSQLRQQYSLFLEQLLFPNQFYRPSKLWLFEDLVRQVLVLVRLLIFCIGHCKLLLPLLLCHLELLVSMGFLHLVHKFLFHHLLLLFLLLIMLWLQLVG